MTAIDSYLERNAAYATKFSRADLAAAPGQRVAVVTCMDARIDPDAMLGLDAGDAHVIRNAGGIATDDVIRSLLVSQCLLGTREIMLIQHTDCGLLTFKDSEMADAIERDTGHRPPFAMGAFTGLDDNVRESIARIRDNQLITHTDGIRGFVCDVKTGRLREVS
ncbi:MAG: carbonic anhydrase [Vicinamibacterales bacterium]|jgi:carbonic anhydrase|nr:carbonic anhydrase [Acidobacteriota bacterium]MDP6372390.1 carbonic anhydrase [Vicinamibacterales bacterium]MDP6608987.1 carbonic anhydrase [Vicinamibacterales bacterium]HAK54339.1 carbonic anhydrase [Acidobacteriota bacterium]|tara:strand:+ start:10160 stop:10651 length:492 start_codon:yes stop_codon:yes gene_type:complete